MKIGIVSDIHCDITAFKRALDDMGPMDLWLSAGDNVLQYRFSNEIFDILRDYNFLTVRGNHEQAVASSAGAALRASGKITQEHLVALEEMPSVIELHIEGRTIVMMHTSPMDPTGGGREVYHSGMVQKAVKAMRHHSSGELERIETIVMQDGRVVSDNLATYDSSGNDQGSGAIRVRSTDNSDLPESKADILVVGHTHQPVIAQIGDTLVINPGSLGQPRNPEFPIRRTYAILDTETWTAEIGQFQQELGEHDAAF